MKKQAEQIGRSMTEMLGVLAIIGVLSIGAIVGFRYAMDKKQANDLINAVSLRAQVALSQLVKNNQITLAEFPESVNGVAILGVYTDPNIVFSVSPIPSKVCQITLDNKPSHWSVAINGVPGAPCAVGDNALDIMIDKESGADEGDTPSPDLCDGACGECQTCNVTTNTCDNLPDTTPCDGGAKECKAGACVDKTSCPPESYPGKNPGECCMDVEQSGEVCCPAGEYLFCNSYGYEKGKCRDAYCSSTKCAPSLFRPVNNKCCSESQTPYCKEFRPGTCDVMACHDGKCTPQQFESNGGVCCPEPNGTPYCSVYSFYRPDECWDSACGKTGCVPVRVGLLGTCCPNENVGFCRDYEWGTKGEKCAEVGCGPKGCKQQPFVASKSGSCCTSDQTAYCQQYDYDYYQYEGVCGYASCANKKCTQQPFLVISDGACCTADEKAYCSEYYGAKCVNAACGPAGCTEYCAKRSDGACEKGACCPAGKTVTVGSGNNPDTCA